jgi:2-polyprenyl-6-methoxyphenol hydroxylase-like FAD-dependent oxidoreductase
VTDSPQRIAISGGGIGGLVLAVGMQRQGVDACVLERQSEIRDEGAGISLWPNALAALDGLNLGDAVRELGVPISKGGLRKRNGRSGPRFSSKGFVGSLGGGLVCVDRGQLVRTLAAILEPGSLRTGLAVTGYERQDSSVQVRVEGGESVRVDALVGADGINSPVASQLNGGLHFAYSGYTAWRGIAETEYEPDRDQLRACLGGGHEFGWMPVGSGRLYWFATACLPEHHDPPEGDMACLAEMFAGWPRPVSDLVAQTPTERLVRNDIVDRVPLKRWSDGPITVLGDAAHPMRPHLGQGGCQAIEDAAALVFCCSDGLFEPTKAFARYEGARKRRTERVVRRSRWSGFTRPAGLAASAFDLMTNSAPSIPIDLAFRGLKQVAGYEAGAKAARPQ